jgi:hypothetical protein
MEVEEERMTVYIIAYLVVGLFSAICGAVIVWMQFREVIAITAFICLMIVWPAYFIPNLIYLCLCGAEVYCEYRADRLKLLQRKKINRMQNQKGMVEK